MIKQTHKQAKKPTKQSSSWNEGDTNINYINTTIVTYKIHLSL